MKIKKIKLVNGQELKDYEINEEVMPLPGYIPVKAANNKQIAYINSSNILYMVVDEESKDSIYIHTVPFPVKVTE